jgi:hypothetical protein
MNRRTIAPKNGGTVNRGPVERMYATLMKGMPAIAALLSLTAWNCFKGPLAAEVGHRPDHAIVEQDDLSA